MNIDNDEIAHREPRLDMRRERRIAVIACIAAAAWLPGPAGSAGARDGEGAVRGFILKTASAAAATLQGPTRPGVLGAEGPTWMEARDLGGGWHAVRASKPMTSTEARHVAAALRARPGVLLVAPDAQEPRAATPRIPNDTLYPQQWWLGAYDAATSAGVPDMQQAWNRSTGVPTGSVPVVAVLDSGIAGHPEVDGHLVLPGYDFVSDPVYAGDGDGRDADPGDPGDRLTAAEKVADPATWDGCVVSETSSWHGTLIAGQIGATSNNAAGLAAMNWNARILPVRVAGRCGASVADLVDGIRWAAGLDVAGVGRNANPARILVIGFAGFAPCDTAHPDPDVAAAAQLYVDTLAAVRAVGAIVIAAAGNERTLVGRPASCRGAFAVTALNRQGFKSIYANYGPQVALATVGGDQDRMATCDNLLADSGVVSTSNTGTGAPGAFGYGAGSGTSFAGPVVAGTASLMLALNPALSADQLDAGLRASARPHVAVAALGVCNAASNPGRCQCTTGTCGSGILDADQALAYAAAPATYVAPVRTPPSLSSSAISQCAALLGLPPVVTPPEPPAAGGGSGGGALGVGWLVGLGLAVALTAASGGRIARPRARRRRSEPDRVARAGDAG